MHYLKYSDVLLLTFSLGLVDSTYKVEDGKSWVLAVPIKLRQVFGLQTDFGKPSFFGFSSQRYEFKVDWKFQKRGVFQLAEFDNKIFAINRHSGIIYEISHKNIPQATEVMGLFTELNIEKNATEDVLPLVMDLHFAFGNLYTSVVRYESKNCERLYLYQIPLNRAELMKPVDLFRTPCISDHENPQM